ncbi:MAG: hypothetical protein NTW21_10820 [Verrucomicrobia bacterium]|nr:hypothetical protein [Verrucomicrobiota bacterium]
MNPTSHSHDTPMDGDDRLMDALLREHARAGTTADEGFLTRLATSLEAEAETACLDPLPASSAPKRPSHRLAWSLGLAASVALAAGLIWKYPLPNKSSGFRVAELAHASGAPLHTEIPPELIEGTPKAITVPHLVPVPDKAPVFLVPPGTVLLSKGKPVTSSDDNPIIGSLDLITDGDKQAGEGYFVELLDGLQWVQIDLEKRATIHAIWLWHYHSQRRAYHDVIVRISDDPEFKTGVITVYNNDYDNSAKLGQASDNPYVESRYGLIVDGKGTKGRYVRLYSNGNTSNEMNHYIEVEAFGIPN